MRAGEEAATARHGPRHAAARRVPSWTYALALLALLVLAALARLLDLDADPPAALSREFLTDEGWWAHNARNHYLFGTWILDDFNQALFAAPVHTLLLRGVFEVLGLGLWQARLLSATAGLLTGVALTFALHRTLGRRAALLGGAVFALDYFSFTYHRVAMVESNANLMATLALALVVLPVRRPVALWASGFVAVVAVLTKMNAVFAFPALALAAVLSTPRGSGGRLRARAASLGWFAAGAACCTAVAFAALVLPNWDEFISQNRRLAVEARYQSWVLLTALFGVGVVGDDPITRIRPSAFLVQGLLPVLLGLGWLGALSLRSFERGLREALTRLHWIEWVALCWLAVLVGYMAFFSNAVDRRYCAMVMPLCILAGSLGSPAWRGVFGEPVRGDVPARERLSAALLLVVAAAVYLRIPVMQQLLPLTTALPLGSEPGLSVGALAALAVAGLVLVGTPLAWAGLARASRLRLATAALPLALVAASLPVLLHFYWNDFGTRTHTMRDAAIDLEQRFGKGARVFGGVANTLLMDSDYRTLFVLDRVAQGDRFYGVAYLDSFEPTHVLSYGAHDEAELRANLAAGVLAAEPVPGSVVIYPLCSDADHAPRFHIGAARIAQGGGAASAAEIGRITPRGGRL